MRSSIGVSVWPDDGRRGDDLLAHAEVAMTTAKERGGNRILFFQAGMTDSMQERLAFENDLRRAMAAGEFELYYQPEISVKTGRIVAAEALLRWRHPTKGIIGPSSFISLAEEHRTDHSARRMGAARGLPAGAASGRSIGRIAPARR